MADRDLRPCPFCGGRDLVIDCEINQGHGDRTYNHLRVRCQNCIAGGKSDYGTPTDADKLKVIDAWNERTRQMKIQCYILNDAAPEGVVSENFTNLMRGLYEKQGFLDSRMVLTRSLGSENNTEYIVDRVVLREGDAYYYLKKKQ